MRIVERAWGFSSIFLKPYKDHPCYTMFFFESAPIPWVLCFRLPNQKHQKLGGGSKYFLFSPLFGEDEPILTSIFFKGVVQPPTRKHLNTRRVALHFVPWQISHHIEAFLLPPFTTFLGSRPGHGPSMWLGHFGEPIWATKKRAPEVGWLGEKKGMTNFTWLVGLFYPGWLGYFLGMMILPSYIGIISSTMK